MTRVFYPGSFDPITRGHMNIIDQATKLFDEIIIAVMDNSEKRNTFFSLEERVSIIKELYKNNANVKVIMEKGATVDLACEYGCKAVVRGLRSLSDYDYEVQLSQINKDISDNKINTVCLFADREFQFISSSMVKEVFYLNKDISKYVVQPVQEKMIEKTT